jgi:hypothetical protein
VAISGNSNYPAKSKLILREVYLTCRCTVCLLVNLFLYMTLILNHDVVDAGCKVAYLDINIYLQSLGHKQKLSLKLKKSYTQRCFTDGLDAFTVSSSRERKIELCEF